MLEPVDRKTLCRGVGGGGVSFSVVSPFYHQFATNLDLRGKFP